MNIEKISGETGLTFDDVLLVPRASSVVPREVDVTSELLPGFKLNIPILSAAMDTVTESRLAIALAQEGGLGIIHRNMSPEKQSDEIDRVKRSESGMISNPITLGPDDSIQNARELMDRYRISGIPITDQGKLVGILTNRDLRFETNLAQPIRNLMTSENLVTAQAGIPLEDAKRILHKHRIEKLPVVDSENNLRGLITVKDIKKREKYPHACKDEQGRLRVGAAVGTGRDLHERVESIVRAGVDLIALDTAHGHSSRVIDAVRWIKSNIPQVPVMAGNVATAEGTSALADVGADIIKIGIGPGSICTTRIIAGVGVPQLTAILHAVEEARKRNIAVVADGGIRFSGDLTKALAAGARAVMLGSLLAGLDESPGEMIIYQGRSFKVYRGMGSVGAMRDGSSDRYFQDESRPDKLVPEGIEGRVPFRGTLAGMIHQLIGGLKAGMGYCGCQNIGELEKSAKFIRVTTAGMQESHAHDVIITRESPNYQQD
ncbi:IMP dehydrogenase [bacterium]|nr:IMP dehydrogenase [candidate division CSSED10-310 bacterium]